MQEIAKRAAEIKAEEEEEEEAQNRSNVLPEVRASMQQYPVYDAIDSKNEEAVHEDKLKKVKKKKSKKGAKFSVEEGMVKESSEENVTVPQTSKGLAPLDISQDVPIYSEIKKNNKISKILTSEEVNQTEQNGPDTFMDDSKHEKKSKHHKKNKKTSLEYGNKIEKLVEKEEDAMGEVVASLDSDVQKLDNDFNKANIQEREENIQSQNKKKKSKKHSEANVEEKVEEKVEKAVSKDDEIVTKKSKKKVKPDKNGLEHVENDHSEDREEIEESEKKKETKKRKSHKKKDIDLEEVTV